VPEALHRGLKARAASEGMSLSDFIKRELHWSMSCPRSAVRMDRYWAGSGSYEAISRPTTPSMPLWPEQREPFCTPKTRNSPTGTGLEPRSSA